MQLTCEHCRKCFKARNVQRGARGYCLITIWEHEFYADPQGCIANILGCFDYEVI